jgi:hypothetical protein
MEAKLPRTLVEVPPDIHHALRIYAVTHRTLVRTLVREALEIYLKKLEKRD